MTRTGINVLTALRHERLGYVVLLCLCLALQGVWPTMAMAAFGDQASALQFVLCNGSPPGDGSVGENPDRASDFHPCIAGGCAMAGCATGVVPDHASYQSRTLARAPIAALSDAVLRRRDFVSGAIRAPPVIS